MGGWQSANPDPNVAEKTAFDIRREGNNNRNDIIIIPVDFSKHAEDAFDCEYRDLLGGSVWIDSHARGGFLWLLLRAACGQNHHMTCSNNSCLFSSGGKTC